MNFGALQKILERYGIAPAIGDELITAWEKIYQCVHAMDFKIIELEHDLHSSDALLEKAHEKIDLLESELHKYRAKEDFEDNWRDDD